MLTICRLIHGKDVFDNRRCVHQLDGGIYRWVCHIVNYHGEEGLATNGLPDVLMTDNGTTFTSTNLKNSLQQMESTMPEQLLTTTPQMDL